MWNFLLAGCLFGFLQGSVYAATFYVAPDGDDSNPGSLEAPFATLQRAQMAVRDLNGPLPPEEPVRVYLRGGLYSMEEPLRFTPEDSGTEQAPVVYTAYADESPLLSGGRVLTGWQQGTDNRWYVDLPDVQSGDWVFRQLFVNGEQRFRARIPNEGFLRVAGFPDGGREVHYHTDCQRFEFAEGDIDPTWTNLNDVEVIVYHFWTDSHLPIRSIDAETNIVTFAHKAGKVFTDDFTSNGARYVVENVFEGLDQPGEWYLNEKTGRLYYLPMDGEDMTSAEVIAPEIPAFLVIRGDALQRKFVEHLRFEDLSFQYNNWRLPPGNSNDRQGSASVPACISMEGARSIHFDQCAIMNTGTFAFEIGEGSTHNRITRSRLANLAAGGIRIHGGGPDDHPLSRTGYNWITDNQIHHFGELYPSAVGILLMDTHSNRVAHNHVFDGWYTGISLGWSWGYQRSVSRDNVVAFNHIHQIGQGLLSDMGAIYTLGVSPGTVLRNNLIHDVNANHYGGWGIYNDEGSSHILIEDNVVYNTKFAAYNIHFCKEVTVRNNIFALGRLQQLSRSRVEPHQSVYFENNIVYWKQGELLDNRWQDQSYDFYFHPKNESGTREVNSTFSMDWNLYFNPQKTVEEVSFNENTWDEWKQMGKDRHSVYADPGFVDSEAHDFRLKPDSPAFDLGFQPIDVEAVGPREPVGPHGSFRPH